jgi:hypothetical protein
MSATRRFPQVEPPPRRGEVSARTSGRVEGAPVGRLLIQAGAITPEALEAALLTQRRTFRPLGHILRTDHGLSAEALAAAIRRQGYIPRVFLRFFPIQGTVVDLLSQRLCAERELVAFELLGDLLCVAFSNPAQRGLVLQLRAETGYEIAVYHAPWDDIQKVVKKEA